MIRLTTADGRFVASADDTPGLLTDGYLTAVLPEDGEYVLEFCDSRFAGTGRAVYRLLIGAVPFAGEVYPMALPRGQNTALELRGGPSRATASSPCGRRPTRCSRCFTRESPPGCWAIPPGPIPTWTWSYPRRSC